MKVAGFSLIWLLATTMTANALLSTHQTDASSTAHSDSITPAAIPFKDHSTPPSPVIAPTLQPFVAKYESKWDLGWFSIQIKGSRILKQLKDGNWQLTFDADSSAASLQETSVFELINGQIQPLTYNYKVTGLVTEPDRSLEFLPTKETVRDHKKRKDVTNQWAPGIQDAQTYMLQASLDLATHPTLPLSYPVFEKKKTKVFNFEVVGEEIIKTKAGKLATVKIQQVRKDNRRVTVWLAKDKQFLLVRLVDKKNGKTRYKIDLVAIESM